MQRLAGKPRTERQDAELHQQQDVHLHSWRTGRTRCSFAFPPLDGSHVAVDGLIRTSINVY